MDFIQNADNTGTLELPYGFISNDYVFQKLHDTLYKIVCYIRNLTFLELKSVK